MSSFKAAILRTEVLDAQWHAITSSDRAEEIEDFEVAEIKLYRPGPTISAFQAARLSAAKFGMELFGTVS